MVIDKGDYMKYLIKGGRVIDPSQDLNAVLDVAVDKGVVTTIGEDIDVKGYTVIDATGLYVVPGLIDMHVHLRDPGFVYKEDIITGSRAAVAGGFTSVVCMPNTKPVIDDIKTINYIKERAKSASCNIYMMGSITKGLDGEELSPYSELLPEGIVGITDDGKSVMDTGIMYEAMKKAKKLDILVSSHCEDVNLVYDRSINSGIVARNLHLEGVPALAEESIIQRDILLAEKTGANIHIQHISSKRGLDMVKEAKARGVKVTCEVTPHHFTLTDRKVLDVGAMAKMSPPLRTDLDVRAIKDGLINGDVDVIATDHAPHSIEEKSLGLVDSANGIIGLETALGISLTELYHKEKMDISQIISKFTSGPANLLNINKGSISVGMDADITIININKSWKVQRDKFLSKSANTPFENMKLKGKALITMVKGDIRYRDK